MLPSGLYQVDSPFLNNTFKTLRLLRLIDCRYRLVERATISLKFRKTGKKSVSPHAKARAVVGWQVRKPVFQIGYFIPYPEGDKEIVLNKTQQRSIYIYPLSR